MVSNCPLLKVNSRVDGNKVIRLDFDQTAYYFLKVPPRIFFWRLYYFFAALDRWRSKCKHNFSAARSSVYRTSLEGLPCKAESGCTFVGKTSNFPLSWNLRAQPAYMKALERKELSKTFERNDANGLSPLFSFCVFSDIFFKVMVCLVWTSSKNLWLLLIRSYIWKRWDLQLKTINTDLIIRPWCYSMMRLIEAQ
jgi:hypothetical protein